MIKWEGLKGERLKGGGVQSKDYGSQIVLPNQIYCKFISCLVLHFYDDISLNVYLKEQIS